MNSSQVSVLMPAYNGERFIRQALDSLLAQTYPHWELIVVDDGSTDDTANIVATYNDRRIRYVHQDNRGQAAALNHGLDLATGEFITTLDVDDWFTPDSLSDRVNYLEEHPEAGVVYGDGIYCDIKGKYLKRFSEYRIGDPIGDVYDILISTPFFGTGGNVMVRRHILDRYQIRYDESIFWCQDWDFYTRVAEHAVFGCVSTILIWYRLHEANLTMSPSLKERRDKSFMKVKRKILNSQTFSHVSVSKKIDFFYSVLAGYVPSRLEDRIAVIEMDQFQSLPKISQAALIRWVASDYLLWQNDRGSAKNLLLRALSLNPFDLKTVVITGLLLLNTKFAVGTLRFWRKMGTDHINTNSPLQLTQELQ